MTMSEDWALPPDDPDAADKRKEAGVLSSGGDGGKKDSDFADLDNILHDDGAGFEDGEDDGYDVWTREERAGDHDTGSPSTQFIGFFNITQLPILSRKNAES